MNSVDSTIFLIIFVKFIRLTVIMVKDSFELHQTRFITTCPSGGFWDWTTNWLTIDKIVK